MDRHIASLRFLRLHLAVSVALLALAGSGSGLAGQRPPRADVERWLTNVPVSGGIRVGFVALGTTASFDPDSFTVFLPADPAPFVCIELSSQDGRYSAKLERSVRGRSSGPFTVHRQSRYRSEVSAYPSAELAILAQLGDECDRPAGPYVLASWDAAPRRDTTVVFLNSRVPTSIVGGPARLTHEARCTSLKGVTTAFNLRCEVPADWLTPDNRFYVRMRRGPTFSQIALPLQLSP